MASASACDCLTTASIELDVKRLIDRFENRKDGNTSKNFLRCVVKSADSTPSDFPSDRFRSVTWFTKMLNVKISERKIECGDVRYHVCCVVEAKIRTRFQYCTLVLRKKTIT